MKVNKNSTYRFTGIKGKLRLTQRGKSSVALILYSLFYSIQRAKTTRKEKKRKRVERSKNPRYFRGNDMFGTLYRYKNTLMFNSNVKCQSSAVKLEHPLTGVSWWHPRLRLGAISNEVTYSHEIFCEICLFRSSYWGKASPYRLSMLCNIDPGQDVKTNSFKMCLMNASHTVRHDVVGLRRTWIYPSLHKAISWL